ncbi:MULTISPECIES: hypothetical protein [Pseudoalteromonas]|uniref:hypothetical protein n=1 Tax=Pseudoalteromonas TaxID=53246 RepID=UPI000FFE9664|nr:MULTISPECIES: hypothetical protein [Pseudoalteromonas]MCG9761171.1 hypothetical protein [Pseudoalteromonas sp. Isolate6]NKC21229.1 hypothetical protein [Pseudoalteromonas galatheae]RXE86020.1 hypothetical protein DRB05_13960 [Pseudoalteromonas sp. A757]
MRNIKDLTGIRPSWQFGTILLLVIIVFGFLYSLSQENELDKFLNECVGCLVDIQEVNNQQVFELAMAISIFSLAISTLILIISLPLYLFSNDSDRAKKAGKLTNTSFGFIIASGTAVIGTLSFG